MSEATAETAAPSTALTVMPDRLVTTSEVAIFDSAAFDQMKQVAVIMADSGLMSETFLKDGDQPAPRPMVIARMMMVADVARDVGANPLMFLQVCSIISRKLHIEGKGVAAIVKARTGVELEYRFGRWETDHIEFPEYVKDEDGNETEELVDPKFFHGIGARLAVRAFDPKNPRRFVDGSVALWKTDRKGSPWTNLGNWRRQLRYRGAPEWARAYEPGSILGIYSDADSDLSDEFDVIGRQPRAKRDLAAKLTNGKASEGPQEGESGFSRDGVAQALGDKPTDAPAASGEVVECEHEFEGEGDDAACKHCGQLEADARPTSAADDTGTGGAQSAEAEPATSGSAEDASAVTAPGPETVEGPAPAGETYLMFGDAYVKDRRLTYKDGVRFSSVGPQGAAKLKAYTEHAPEIVAETEAAADDDEGDITQPCEACGAEAGEECKPDCPALAEEAGEGAGAAVEPVAETEAEPETGFLATLKPMKSWTDEFKPACAALFKTSDYQGASETEKNELRTAIWAKVIASGAKVDQADDPSAYGLWLAWIGNTRDDADAVEGTFNTLQRSERWGKMTEAGKKPLEDRTAAKLASIRGGNG